ncbi:MAG: hypothetical protein KAT04_11455 [Methylococcales bacterium]|nr:hypothetical protein [Methylococcales bacterium]
MSEKSTHTHLVFIRQNIEDISLSVIDKYCHKQKSTTCKDKKELIVFASNIIDTHGFYLSLTAHFSNNESLNIKIPHHLVFLIQETQEHIVGNSIPFGFNSH